MGWMDGAHRNCDETSLEHGWPRLKLGDIKPGPPSTGLRRPPSAPYEERKAAGAEKAGAWAGKEKLKGEKMALIYKEYWKNSDAVHALSQLEVHAMFPLRCLSPPLRTSTNSAAYLLLCSIPGSSQLERTPISCTRKMHRATAVELLFL